MGKILTINEARDNSEDDFMIRWRPPQDEVDLRAIELLDLYEAARTYQDSILSSFDDLSVYKLKDKRKNKSINKKALLRAKTLINDNLSPKLFIRYVTNPTTSYEPYFEICFSGSKYSEFKNCMSDSSWEEELKVMTLPGSGIQLLGARGKIIGEEKALWEVREVDALTRYIYAVFSKVKLPYDKLYVLMRAATRCWGLLSEDEKESFAKEVRELF